MFYLCDWRTGSMGYADLSGCVMSCECSSAACCLSCVFIGDRVGIGFMCHIGFIGFSGSSLCYWPCLCWFDLF